MITRDHRSSSATLTSGSPAASCWSGSTRPAAFVRHGEPDDPAEFSEIVRHEIDLDNAEDCSIDGWKVGDACVFEERSRFRPVVTKFRSGREHIGEESFETLEEAGRTVFRMMDQPTRLLRKVGHALYSDRWQSTIARDLGYTDRTVRYWLSNLHTLPGEINDRMMVLVCKRIRELRSCVEMLDRRGVGIKPTSRL